MTPGNARRAGYHATSARDPERLSRSFRSLTGNPITLVEASIYNANTDRDRMMTTRQTAFNHNTADAGGTPLPSPARPWPANDNGTGGRSSARRVVALVACAVSDGTPPLALAIYVGLAVLAVGAFVFAG